MKNLKKTTRLAGAFAIALGLAAPLTIASATPTLAADYGHSDSNRGHDNGYNAQNNNFRYGYDARVYRDRDHKPPVKFERMPPRPHAGWHFHRGHWKWAGNHWTWVIGVWSIR